MGRTNTDVDRRSSGDRNEGRSKNVERKLNSRGGAKRGMRTNISCKKGQETSRFIDG